jgi:hypothetical protein
MRIEAGSLLVHPDELKSMKTPTNLLPLKYP